MYNSLDKEAVMFQDYFESILTYIDTYQPSAKETLEFTGALLYCIFDMIDINEEEKVFALASHKLIKKRILLKEVKKIETKEKESLCLLKKIERSSAVIAAVTESSSLHKLFVCCHIFFP
jgi:hypothetical protein